mmetsp:Transcript_15287/g.20944  ORF Transcript_15287/g.20944 Transcript_15287/m.20944 type:complete len:439 (-) Transcript_15287:422-1738(-)|eukprot:CAMPEP_0170078962 /NCGR_PEP_ID=MMETSP0019_2-20121128/15463_1 /TAXON_ID=98059 /ORGANISM="Dinobryon sp., Strain UTEXLB2267" /LENGTH=438 /DNA_ID=CAMNT_0010292183 /DNA_START=131 /DNA_END=1447 /DNA_ORIENTATION=-
MGNKLPKEKETITQRPIVNKIPPGSGNASGNSQNTNSSPSSSPTGASRMEKPKSAEDLTLLNKRSVNTSSHSPPSPSESLAIINTGNNADYAHFNNKLTISDFDLLKVLGKGSFGKVMLVKKKDDDKGTLYAMKTLRKAALVKRNQLAHTSTERTILQNINCPFLVHLIYAFQTVDKLYMVLDYMAGGELFFWLKKDRKFSEPRARLYAAEITVALDALHSADIVYRDLKPENILLDAAGHIRITDFGLAKAGITGYDAVGGTKTFCGTPEYLAPEILDNKGHGKAVDWWALGTLLFEMLTGLPPYYDTNVQRMYHKILHDPLKFPKSEGRQMSEDARDILKGLLERKVSDRLGSGGATQLKRSRFFSVYGDFSGILRKTHEAEFIPPAATSMTDVRNFDKEFTSEPAADSMVVSHMSETMQEKSNFEGFTYKGDKKL